MISYQGNTTFQDRNDFTFIIKYLSFEPYITLSISLGFGSRKFTKTYIHEYGRKWKQRCWCYAVFENRVSLFQDSHDRMRNPLSFNGKYFWLNIVTYCLRSAKCFCSFTLNSSTWYYYLRISALRIYCNGNVPQLFFIRCKLHLVLLCTLTFYVRK